MGRHEDLANQLGLHTVKSKVSAQAVAAHAARQFTYRLRQSQNSLVYSLIPESLRSLSGLLVCSIDRANM